MTRAQKPDRSDLVALFKRGQTSLEPQQFTLITAKTDSMYDARIHLPVPDQDVLNIAAVGYVEPVAVRLRGDEAIIVDGVQRVKRGLVLNAVVGVWAYTGNVQAIKEAIIRLSASDSAVGRRLIELCPRGVKVPISIHRGADKDAYAAKVSANEYRQGDPIIEKARKAQSLAKHGHDESDIAAMFNVSTATVKRWLVMDTEKERSPRKKRSKSTRPTPARIAKTLGVEDPDCFTARERILVAWLLGNATEDKLFETYPELKPEEAAA